MCCEPHGGTKEDGEEGECPVCGAKTYGGVSVDICGYSPMLCEYCGDAPCDQSC